MKPKVVTFGEIMLRLSPPGFERFLQSPRLVATFGGGEANVAVSLAQFGLDSHYVTRAAEATPSATRPSARCAPKASAPTTSSAAASRIGIYFAEAGASQRASTVIYDRAHSAISEMAPDAVDWDDGLRRARTGSTSPASRRRSATNGAAATRRAIAAARRAGARSASI